jgi:hypothetical protein
MNASAKKAATTVVRRAARRATPIAAGRDTPVAARMTSRKIVKGIMRPRISVDCEIFIDNH